MSGPKRDDKGPILPGSSGNLRGRPAKERRRHAHPHSNNSVAFEIAAIEVTVTVNGRSEKRSLYEANLIRVGVDGASGKISSARTFLNEIGRAARENDGHGALVRSLLGRIEDLEGDLDAVQKRYPRHGVVRVPWDEFAAMRRAEEDEKRREALLADSEDETGVDESVAGDEVSNVAW
jgi:hypothetical protein